MAPNPAPLLSADDRAEVLRMFSEQTKKYGELSAAITAGKPVGEIKTAIDKIDADFAAMHAKYDALVKRAGDIEERLNYKPAEPEPAKSIGRQVIEDPGFIAAVKSPTGRFSHTVRLEKANLWSVKDIGGVSRLFGMQVQPGVAAGPRLPFGVRTLVPQGNTSAGAVSYLEESSFTNNAAVVAEMAPKPKSDKVYTPRTGIVETIAHYFKVSKQTLADLPAVQASIENNGIYGVQVAEDDELLNGTGVSPHLKGFNAVALAAPGAAAGESLIDAIGIAFFDLASKGFLPDGAVVNPADWGAVAMLKNSQGNYLFANPLDYSGILRVWGMRLVLSAKQTAGTFLAGAFQGHSQILDREGVNVQVATQNEDDFIHNMVTILVEERLVNLIYNAAAFEKGVVPAAAGGGATSATSERRSRG